MSWDIRQNPAYRPTDFLFFPNGLKQSSSVTVTFQNTTEFTNELRHSLWIVLLWERTISTLRLMNVVDWRRIWKWVYRRRRLPGFLAVTVRRFSGNWGVIPMPMAFTSQQQLHCALQLVSDPVQTGLSS